jgi:hypothetical protein
MCEHLYETTDGWIITDPTIPIEIFNESGCIDNHRFVVCGICGDYIDLGAI